LENRRQHLYYYTKAQDGSISTTTLKHTLSTYLQFPAKQHVSPITCTRNVLRQALGFYYLKWGELVQYSKSCEPNCSEPRHDSPTLAIQSPRLWWSIRSYKVPSGSRCVQTKYIRSHLWFLWDLLTLKYHDINFSAESRSSLYRLSLPSIVGLNQEC
jgi:hypothetical protein